MSELVLSPHPTREGYFVLARSFRYVGARDVFTVPEGFVTDFASVPRFLWPLLPPYGRHGRAAVVHDWLYLQRPEVTTRARGVMFRDLMPRRDADGIFRRIMIESGVPRWKAWLLWAGVRLGGWRSWGKRRTRGT